MSYSRRLTTKIDQSDPKAQTVTYELGSWNIENALTGSEYTPITVAAYKKRVAAAEARIATMHSRVMRCVEKHSKEFRKLRVTTNGYRVRLLGTRKETEDEVKKRVTRAEKRKAVQDRDQRSRDRATIRRMVVNSPDLIRSALRKYDREEAMRIVGGNRNEVEKALDEKK